MDVLEQRATQILRDGIRGHAIKNATALHRLAAKGDRRARRVIEYFRLQRPPPENAASRPQRRARRRVRLAD